MASFNKVILAGNLTRDPESRFLTNGTALASVGLAVSRRYTQNGEKKEETTFVDVTIFGKTAENVGRYCRKGSSVLIEGRLKLDQWNDKQTGAKRTKLTVVADTVQFLTPRGQGQDPAQPAETPAGAPESSAEADAKLADDDIPF